MPDTDHRRQTELEQLRSVLDQAPGYIIIMRGPDHVVQFVNKAHQDAFNSQDWLGFPIRSAFRNIEGQEWFERVDGVYRTGQKFNVESAAIRFRGTPDSLEETRYLTFVCAPLRDDGGNTTGIFCEGFDVTDAHHRDERFRAQLDAQLAATISAVRQSDATIRTIFETSYMNQGLLSPDGKIVYVNATSLASIKSQLQDVVGKDFWETPWFTGTPGMPEQVREGVARVAAGESIQISMPLNMPTGKRIYEFSMRPAMDERGKVVALVPEAVEITARVRAEEALQQSVKMEALGDLTGGVAHDFNNLLMVILGSLELLRKRLPDDALVRRLIDNAMEGARRGTSLTARLLAFARKQELRPERSDIGELLSGMSDMLERSLGPTVILDIKIEAPGLQAEIDRNQLENAVLNLVVNARDAMPAGGTITIVTTSFVAEDQAGPLKPGRYVCLSVTDTGEGMDAETIKQATDPFFTTKGVGKGTGLGLSMVHGLAQQSGGALVLKSSSGVGTTAEIFLPTVDATIVIEPDAPPMLSMINPVAARNLRILVVDDDQLILANTIDMLQDLGHVAVPAVSGAEALEQLERMQFDLMITDHAMPRMTGSELASQTRMHFPEMRMILATGYAEMPLGVRVDLPRLSKPFSQGELAEAVAKAMQVIPAKG
jgi:signal transduction histidine kinase